MSSAFQGCQTETTAPNNFIKGKPSHCEIHDCFLLLHSCIIQNAFCFVVNEKAATDDKSHRTTSFSFLLQIGCAENHTDLRQSSQPLLAELPMPAPLFSSFSGRVLEGLSSCTLERAPRNAALRNSRFGPPCWL